jgi:chromosomal replication initiator protein
MNDKPGQQLLLNFPSHPEYDFSNFVVSEGSRIAFETAKEFCSENPVPYQALYLFGQKNLGKTHLLLSIGNRAAEEGLRAVCIQGHDFVDKIGGNPSPEAQQTLEQLLNVDFFLMDNVESLANSPTAQEKLYHIYNQMMEKGGKLAFTAGLPPDRNSAMESYLTSRFQWGIVNRFDLRNHSPLKSGSKVAFHSRISVRREACSERKLPTLFHHLVVDMVKFFLCCRGVG